MNNGINGTPGKWSTVNITVAALTALSAGLVLITGIVAFIGGAMISVQNSADFKAHIEALQSSYNTLANSFTEMKGDVKRMQSDISEMRQKR